jgi:hypothetical protein
VEYTYSGQASFAIPFSLGILNRAYVTIQINNQVDGSGDPLYYTNFTWTSDSEVVINGLTNGDIIKIARTIPSNLLLSDYTAGSNITRDNLNIANKQLIMLIHEVLDKNVTQQTKLDTIESGATADQTAAEIKTAYESNANTNAFTDADESKLDGIEAGADITDTANVTAAGAVMDSEVTDLVGIKAVTVSTLQVKPAEGAFVDGDKTKLNTIETNADVTDTANVVAALTAGTNITIASDGTIASTATGGGGGVSDIVDDLTPQLGGDLDLNNQDITGTGNISITGTVNTRDMAVDGAKLDAIEAGATADQTKADIDALGLDYNNLVNTPTIPGSGPSGYATESYVDTAVADIVDSAPGTLDTLNELAQALGDDPNFATTTATNLSQKLPKAGGTMTGKLTLESSDPEIFLVDTNTNVTTSIDANSSAGSLQIHVDKDETASDPKFIVNVGSQNNVLVAKSTGIDVTGNVDLPDNGKLLLGAYDDLQIYHDASNSYIRDVGTGNLFIDATSLRLRTGAGTETYLTADGNGSVDLYYDNSKKFETTSTGIDVTGNVNSTASLTFGSGGAYEAGSIYSDANWGMIHRAYTASPVQADHLFVNSAGTERMRIDASGIDVTGNVVGDGLTIAGDATFTGGGTGSIVINDEDSSLCPTMTFLRNGGGTTTNDFIKFENSGGEVANIDSTGGALFRELKVKGSNTRRIDISNTTLADTGEMATLQWDNSANFTIQGRTSASVFAANWYSIQTSDTDGRADAHIFYTDASTERMRINSTGIDVTGAIDVANGTTYTTTGDFLAKVQQNSNASGKNGLSVMNAWASSTSTIFEAAMGWNGSAAGYYPVFTIDGLGKTTWKDNAGNVRATIDGNGLDVNGSNDTVGASNTRQWSVGTAGAKMGVYALDNGTMYMRVESGSSTNFQFGTYDNIPIYTITNNTVRTTLLGNGNFGVGTTNPSAKIEAFGTDASIIVHNSFNSRGGIGALSGGRVGLVTTSINDDLVFGYSGSPISSGSFVERMRIDNGTGNVGVGTSSPSYKIDVRGDANTDVGIQVKASGTGDVDAELRLDAADTGESLVRYARDGTTRAVSEYTNSNEWNFTTYNDDKIDFQPNSTNVLRLTDDNIYAYKTVNVTGGVTVSTNLNVGNATPAGGGTIESHVQSSSTPALITYSGSSLLRTHISFENANGQVGKINTAGTQTFYITSSDYRLKTDIQPMQGSIDRIKALKPCNFQWTLDGTRVDGFIAHEAQEVVPEAIVGEKDATKTNKDGVEVPDYQGIDQSKLVPLLTSALQEALAKIDDLELRMANLES